MILPHALRDGKPWPAIGGVVSVRLVPLWVGACRPGDGPPSGPVVVGEITSWARPSFSATKKRKRASRRRLQSESSAAGAIGFCTKRNYLLFSLAHVVTTAAFDTGVEPGRDGRKLDHPLNERLFAVIRAGVGQGVLVAHHCVNVLPQQRFPFVASTCKRVSGWTGAG